MAVNLGGRWDYGVGVADRFCQSIPRSENVTVKWGYEWPFADIYLENGIFRRAWHGKEKSPYDYYRLTVKSPIWRPDSAPSDRWEQLGHKIYPETDKIENILLAGAVDLCAGYNPPLKEVHQWILDNAPGGYVKWRKHPLYDGDLPVHEVSSGTFDEDLEWSDVVVVYNSMFGWEALRRGKKVICHHTAPYYGNDREQMLWSSAYCQWNEQEISDGTAWNYLKQYL